MRSTVSAGVFLLILCAVLGGPAAAQPAFRTALDARQPAIDTSGGALAIGGSSAQRLAQTLTLEQAGTLLGVYLPLGCSSGRLQVELRNVDGDLPGETVLWRRSFAPEPSGIDRFVFVPVGRGRSVAAGERLALVLFNRRGACGLASGPPGESYAGGDGFFEAGPNPPGWLRFGDRFDLPFVMVVQR